ncbi:hypothetical protein fugu_001030 [Takifugu bimaculatus]|uniref:Fibronectin type-III domain-containing protein n=1 Tax=Takifugu bimaculatus TaxID=433685 RepID=A0A4Z2CIK2_9TELE|nr:hypothetical protein fugu_001030 [Takifugu bimaculatus]
MLGTRGVMDRCFHLRLKLWTLLALWSAGTICQTAADPRLQCINDFIFTINCSLKVASENASQVYWLFIKAHDGEEWCHMTEVDGGHFCSINTSSLVPEDYDYAVPLDDTQEFNIFLCSSNVSSTCSLLIKEYTPQTNIKPNAPCCLRLSHNAAHYHFTWRSTYEGYSDHTALTRNMLYQLRYYTRGPESNISSHEMTTESLNCKVRDEILIPGAEYGAQVRSSPNQVSYQGQWSDWSSEIHWKTEPAGRAVTSAPLLSGLRLEFLGAMVLLLLLPVACVKMWRRHAYIPTPAPYFHTLYNDYHGDFKSWVVTGDQTADALKREEVLRIDTLTRYEEVQEEEPRPRSPQQMRQEAMYSNIPHPGFDSSLLGAPYAVSTAAPAEEGPRCWVCSKVLERGAPLYSNEYCTLKAFHQSHSCSGVAAAPPHAEYEN